MSRLAARSATIAIARASLDLHPFDAVEACRIVDRLSSYAPAHIETTVQYADKAIAEARATPDAEHDALARFAISRLVFEMERTMVRLVSWNVEAPLGSPRHLERR